MKQQKRHKLQQARLARHFTQAKMADYLGMTPNSYQAIELARRGTTEKNWLKLFNCFNQQIPLSELMEISDNSYIACFSPAIPPPLPSTGTETA